MSSFVIQLDQFNTWLWNGPLLVLLVIIGVYLTLALRGVQFRWLGYAIREAIFPSDSGGGEKGDISPFESLMTTLAGAIGTGSIVGVTTALKIGGLGSLFWMWVAALLLMATKYAESFLAVKYRVQDHRGEMIGGPMEYMSRGLGWKKMATIFAVIGAAAALGTGNLVQSNSIAGALEEVAGFPPLFVGIAVAVALALVVMGGVQSIGRVAGILVPFMALIYLAGGIVILVLNWSEAGRVFGQIFTEAFSLRSAAGGVGGMAFARMVQVGLARAVFTTEAGLGIPSIAAAAARTDSPAKQGLVIMTSALLGTIFICTMTGLVVGVSGLLDDPAAQSGAGLAIAAFSSALPYGHWIVVVGLVLFAFSTIVAWSYYGEKCAEYAFGEGSILWYRLLFILVVIPGAVVEVDLVWEVSDFLNALLALPNLLSLMMLVPVVIKGTKMFEQRMAS